MKRLRTILKITGNTLFIALIVLIIAAGFTQSHLFKQDRKSVV